MKKTIPPHQFRSTDPWRPRNHRCCDTCGLPETRADVHTWPVTPADVSEHEAARMGEKP